MDSISVLNTAYIICLAMAILFFVISVVLFFLFDIRTIYMIRSGRAQAKTVKEMQEINASTGRLRVAGKTQTGSMKKEKPHQNVIQPPSPAVNQTPAQPAADYPQEEDYSEGYATTEKLPAPDAAAAEVLPTFDGGEDTTVLRNYAETSVLASNEAKPSPTIYFDVIKKIALCDTEEIIR